MNFDLETILGMLEAGLTPVELLGAILGLLGPLLILASFAMKRMIPLRTLALLGNVVLLIYGLVVYGLIPTQLPSLVLSCILIPLNAFRLWEIKKLSRDIAQATQESPFSPWLLPHMRNRSFKAGEVLFRKGDAADRIFYVAQGEVRMEEIGETLGAGALIGEIGLFSPDKKRTLTLVCQTDGELYEMTDEMIFQLYYQNPKLGFYFLRLVTARLLKDIQRHAAAASREKTQTTGSS